ncbi:hypothetical protein GCM10023149_37290 [Mucilaginibacter gynuensis]|uniref:Secretion system C-terminal sorting domain-containing protein n=1 Tax=Mucilaginibacter gynuensis TaxID=1302236 RepID=A0ABP8GXL9_9SPHI
MGQCFTYSSASLKKAVLLILAVIAFDTADAQNRLKFVQITPSQNTGQDYSPWLDDNLDSLVQEAWQNNFVYVDVKLRFKYRSKISQLKFYDYTGVFDDKPAEIYAIKDTTKTFLGIFTGPGYKIFQYINLQTPVEADGIVIHKYSNNIPQKIFAFGTEDASKPTTADVQPEAPVQVPNNPTIPTETPDGLVKIPIESDRWYQLNNVSDGLQGMFDGNTENEVYTGWGKIFNNYDAYYPVKENEKIDIYKLKFYNRTGGLGTFPLTVSVIDSTGKRSVVGIYKGGYYQKWLGPNPDNVGNFYTDSVFKNIKYIVLNCWYQFPTEIEFYGAYDVRVSRPETTPPPDDSVADKSYPLNNYFGVNAFEWDFEDGANPDNVETNRMTAVKTFSAVRHYMDWQKLESEEDSYTYSPTRSGGWSYDAMYLACKNSSIEVLADLKTLPDWMLRTYPEAERDAENVPVRYGADFSLPASYIDQAKVGFQFAARYGYNTKVDKSLLSVNSTPRWNADPVNKVRVGLGYIKYIECDNERDKWWKGRKGYQTAFEYAANMSAFYDGHKNTMGPGVGIKNADPAMKVVMAGLASASPEYLHAMVEWCKVNRGYKADGTVNLCWDVINYHWYSHDAQMIPNSVPTRGVAPEVGGTFEKAKQFLKAAHDYANDMPVWVTEVGYDANPNSPMRAIPIGKKTILQTQADWILRSSLLYARAGVERIFFYQMYDDNYENPIQYGSSGLMNQDRSRKPAANFINQVKKLIGRYSYRETLHNDPIVDRYEYEGKSAYIGWIPDEKGRTATYEFNLGTDSANVYTLSYEGNNIELSKRKLVNGRLIRNLTETPTIIVPYGISNSVNTLKIQSNISDDLKITNKVAADTSQSILVDAIKLFPNPSTRYVNVSFNNKNFKSVNITVSDISVGRVYSSHKYTKAGEDFSQTIDISQVPMGVCLVVIKQDDKVTVKRVIKTN